MRVSSVSYGFTKNLGNFQSQRVDATVELQEGDDFDTALSLAAAVVNEALDLGLTIDQGELLTAEHARVQEAAFLRQEALSRREARGGGTR